MPLDAEEQAILESVENGEWHSIANLVQESQQYQQYAQSHRNGLETVNIRFYDSTRRHDADSSDFRVGR